ncbi:MAG: EAL domain-containing protein [Sulfuricurvum sp.]|jgi:diguanylate cyclase (GGDEF)-like protein/PAS domain S-box-containing protein|uniref:EAL domain-containing protein n=1 Tax=Sulfuricurvum sp. TaxID=2025608 RepID=UPI0025FF80EF|nr:EAL domain-containing protein [Sulfuricurvum sp.]MCK9374464.1 EAL domain-containing protein [Sulfuricurvum sp.]
MNHATHTKKIHILVVEDSLTQAEEIRFFLENDNYTVTVCHDGEEAYEWLERGEQLPDVIVSDVMMPRMDGYELCKAIRSDDKLKAIPVILLTSLSEPHDIIKSIEAGANKFLTKPFDHKRLPEVIDELYINTQRRSVERMEMGIRLMFGGNDFLITADKVQILDLLLSSYEDSYYKNIQLQQTRSELEKLNAKLEEKIQERTKELRIQEEKFRTLAEHTPDLIVRIDRHRDIVYMNKSMENLFDIFSEELIGKPISELDDISIGGLYSHFVNELFESGKEIRTEFEIQTPHGLIWIDSTFVPEYDEKGEIEYVLKVSSNITERKKAENELRKLTQAVEQSPSSIIITDREGKIEYVNTIFTETSGYLPGEAIGKNIEEIQTNPMEEKSCDEILDYVTGGHLWHRELMSHRKDGTESIESVKISPIYDTDGTITHCMVVKEDITEKKRAEERIHYLANFDILTGLPNRVQLEERLKYSIEIAKRHNGELAVMFLDIDHFKDINDTLGHHIGDMLLVEMAKRFQSILREEDAVSRLSGDEFVFMVSHTNLQGIIYVVQKLLETIATPLTIELNELMVTASIGIAIYPMDGSDNETLTKNADAAMYQAKQDGRNSYRFFTKAMQERSARNLQLSNALHHALERGQLHIVYQPQISLVEDRVIGAEALLRWSHPELGNISPAEFIPLAEDIGLILPIGEWVLRNAIREAKGWREKGLSPMVVAVNLSAVQFRHPRLPEVITKILDEVGLPSRYLELELTEAVAMHNPQGAISVMDHLHDLGIRMSIDDFGTGYSSLSYLKQFKVYKLKIDQSFIREITDDSDDKAIVNAVISMAHSLGLQTIAEGVETVEQLDYLHKQGCDEIQGYYYSKPLLPDDFEIFVREKNRS